MTEDWDFNAPLVENDAWTKTAKSLLGLLDTPAYLRRAMTVQAAVEHLKQKCQTQREQLLDGVRMRLRHWDRAVENDPQACRQFATGQEPVLQWLRTTLLNGAPSRTYGSLGRPAVVWNELADSVERFNRRWTRYLQAVPTERVNELIDGYNRHYVFEKECAFRSARVAGRGFTPMAAFDFELLLSLFPLLPELPRR